MRKIFLIALACSTFFGCGYQKQSQSRTKELPTFSTIGQIKCDDFLIFRDPANGYYYKARFINKEEINNFKTLEIFPATAAYRYDIGAEVFLRSKSHYFVATEVILVEPKEGYVGAREIEYIFDYSEIAKGISSNLIFNANRLVEGNCPEVGCKQRKPILNKTYKNCTLSIEYL